ncbi:hypothetical protein J4727_14285 [Providencia rettgeri]|uniref:Uncharacterized protein n=1 Tax=Providencia rettgeri TaxID=587 RepID=A0A939SPD1_PRORE|nr:hypothetical protein [Providencia rettgeri]
MAPLDNLNLAIDAMSKSIDICVDSTSKNDVNTLATVSELMAKEMMKWSCMLPLFMNLKERLIIYHPTKTMVRNKRTLQIQNLMLIEVYLFDGHNNQRGDDYDHKETT